MLANAPVLIQGHQTAGENAAASGGRRGYDPAHGGIGSGHGQSAHDGAGKEGPAQPAFASGGVLFHKVSLAAGQPGHGAQIPALPGFHGLPHNGKVLAHPAEQLLLGLLHGFGLVVKYQLADPKAFFGGGVRDLPDRFVFEHDCLLRAAVSAARWSRFPAGGYPR